MADRKRKPRRVAPANLGAAWIEALGSAVSGSPDEVPEDFHTVKEVAALTGFSGVWTYKKLLRLVEQGKAEKRTFRIVISNQRTLPVSHYKINGGI